MADDTPASPTPNPLYDWRRVAEKSIRYHCSFRPIGGMVPGDDEMYHLLVGDAPVQHYTVVMSPVTQLSSTKSISRTYRTAGPDRAVLSLWMWCCLIVISGIVAFTTTLLISFGLDFNDADTTEATEWNMFTSSTTPSTPTPPIVDPYFTTLQNDTDYYDIS
ncbi:hypothetical protein MTO96_035852 [Rhipicephalus appendiculatus]